ncbi:MAG: peptidylprolyl isomerase [Myxococcales bacterium]|nr:peptidylprolyl isomerase [Myxococcales bacterium]
MEHAQVAFGTEAGEIAIEVFATAAPRTAAYFLALVDSGAYAGCAFYRSTDLGVEAGPRLIQGGPLARVLAPSASADVGAAGAFRLLEAFETTAESGLRHEAGSVSLARDLLDTGHALPEVFLCLGRFPQLDAGGRSEPDARGFPAFGRIVRGLDVAQRIAGGETNGATPIAMLSGQILTRPVRIDRVSRV